MDGYLSNKFDNFVDDPKKLYRLRRREAQQAKKLDFVDSKSRKMKDRWNLRRIHRLEVLRRIDFHQ
jgi:hypothetical protein